MEILHKESGNRGRFYIEEDSEIVAEIVYANSGNDSIIIEHTEVNDKLKGQNIGLELVHKTVDHARKNGLKVSPVCSFARAVFDKSPDFKDVLA